VPHQPRRVGAQLVQDRVLDQPALAGADLQLRYLPQQGPRPYRHHALSPSPLASTPKCEMFRCRASGKARKRLRNKIPALQTALRGRVTEHHRFQLRLLLDHVTHLEELIGRLGAGSRR
jgi:hypothetical protein